ncbi:MAG: phosphatase PAP2 family protein, partial [Elusimicrobiota bacterium]
RTPSAPAVRAMPGFRFDWRHPCLIHFAAFAGLSLVTALGLLNQFDLWCTRVLQFFAGHETDCRAGLFNWVGSPEFTGLVTLILAGLFWLKFSPRQSLFFLGAMALGTIVEVAAKFWLPQMPNHDEIQRGCEFLSGGIITMDSPGSYPSGHMFRTAFLIFIVDRFRIFGSGLINQIITRLTLILLIILMLATRVYLGEHWASDVIGGLILALAVSLLVPAPALPSPLGRG